MRLAVLDLGSTSLHLLVAQAATSTLQPLARKRTVLHLGAAVERHGGFTPPIIDSVVTAVVRLQRWALRVGAEYVIGLATSAFREAANGYDVARRVTDAAGIQIRVLSGVEEARLAYRGASARLGLDARTPRLVLDLGGGSLDLAAGTHDEPAWAATLPLGVSRLGVRFLREDRLSVSAERDLRAQVASACAGINRSISSDEQGTAVVVGGPFRALMRAALTRRTGREPVSVEGAELRRCELDALATALVGTSLADRVAIPGVKPRRALHLPVAAVVAAESLRRLGLQRACVTDWGVRHGALLDAVAALPSHKVA
ncbi:MAG: Ppx/GppA phosphatase family protein [Egibacteraceae bacterium]